MSVVWVDGVLGGSVDAADRGFTLGDGVFDTLAAFSRTPFAGERHLQRLSQHAAAIGVEVDAAAVRRGWEAVLAAAPQHHLVLRTTITRGVAGRGLWPKEPPRPTLVVAATPWSPASFAAPAELVTSATTRHAGSPLSRLKSLNYLDNVLAAREAAERGAGDALLLNAAGRVACTTIANVFAVAGGRLLTPPPAEGAMPGVLRALVLESAAAAGLAAVEEPLTPQSLHAADGVFLTNSLRFLSPVTALDGRALGAGAKAPVAALLAVLAERVLAECGCDPRRIG